jgi:hypothetical protein
LIKPLGNKVIAHTRDHCYLRWQVNTIAECWARQRAKYDRLPHTLFASRADSSRSARSRGSGERAPDLYSEAMMTRPVSPMDD